ncbi:MAG: Na/Pi cotransporter family protein, partial [Planctomycetes bacterium]|nr:Na/Pi cotransporter family protein [Planctomycetota bacterium]
AYIGVIDYPTAAALVLGENIGTTITAYLASLGASSNAKRASYAHMVINIIGVLWITAIFSAYTALIVKIVGTDPGTGIAAEDGGLVYPFSTTAIAATHTGFNVVNVLIFLPFIGWLNKLLYIIVPEKAHREVPHLRFIDVRMLDTPTISIQQSRREVMRMGEHVEKMLSRLRLVIVDDKPNEKSESKIFHREEVLDIVQKEIVEFLTDLLSGTVPHDVMNSGRMQLRMADEYESISDYLTNILKLKLKLRDSDLKMTDAARREILDLHEHVSAYVKFINEGVQTRNSDILSKAITQGDAITHLIKQYRSDHLERMESGNISALKSLIFTDMLGAYRRVKDHALNIAETLAGEK